MISSVEAQRSGRSASQGPSSRRAQLIGTTLDGRYRLESILGEGSMGTVYAARHTVIDRRVAIKVLRDELADDSEAAGRFATEAQAASAIGNEHIVSTLDFGIVPGGATYLVMEYLEGRTLGDLLARRGRLTFDETLIIVRQIADGLLAAHEAGVVHRDLKPDNILLVRRDDGQPFIKILDFGIAKIASAQKRMTRVGQIFGTPHYMSPEQAAGQPTDARSDIYALGVIIYELAAGRVPFDAEAPLAVLSQHMYSAPPLLGTVLPAGVTLPHGFEYVVQRCLEKLADRRYQSISELLTDLAQVERGLATRATLPSIAPSATLPAYGAASVPSVVPPAPPSSPRATSPAISEPMQARPEAPTWHGTPRSEARRELISIAPSSSPQASSRPPEPTSWIPGATSQVAARAPASQHLYPTSPPLDIPLTLDELRPARGHGWAKVLVMAGSIAALAYVIWNSAHPILKPAEPSAPPQAAPTVYIQVPTPAPSAFPPGTRHTSVVVLPLDAHIFQNEQDLGMTPVTVNIPPNEVVSLLVRRSGFQTMRVKVDGRRDRIVVNLRKWSSNRAEETELSAEGREALSEVVLEETPTGDVVTHEPLPPPVAKSESAAPHPAVTPAGGAPDPRSNRRSGTGRPENVEVPHGPPAGRR